MRLRNKREYKMAWRIIELIQAINDIKPTYKFEELMYYYDLISLYNIETDKYKSGHKYGELKDGT